MHYQSIKRKIRARDIYLCMYTLSHVCVHTVHGFTRVSYNVDEGESLETIFELNVKGETKEMLSMLGNITAEPSATARMSMLS